MDPTLYLHRGFMLDTGRKFFPVEAILELLDVLHEYNFNVFHWHIYDAESFPMHWPEDRGLTNASIKHSHTANCYSPDDICKVVNHAQRLGICVYPETDMPGHADIWGKWKKELVVGKPDLKRPEAQLDIRTHKQETYDYVRDLVNTTDRYFASPLHHFGGDEVAYMWDTEDDNKLFEGFINWLKTLSPSKSLILWDDPLTDEEKDIKISKDWIIQTWHNDVSQDVLNKGHRIIVSESKTFYIGNADSEKISSFAFPDSPNILGFELVWFTSEGDDPYDFRQSWVMEPIRAAAQIHVPYATVTKVGREDEQDHAKPGNRGKRNSQRLVYNFLHYVNYCRLWKLLFEKIEFQMRACLNIDATEAMHMLVVDSDTVLEKTGISYLVHQLQKNPKLVGLCGYTGVNNPFASFVAMNQVFEYWLTHAVLKAVGTVFSNVLVLSGCFAIYRLKWPNNRPAVLHPVLLEDYAGSYDKTLHEHNLLSIGEDRYLSTLAIRYFEADCRLQYFSAATYTTTAPDTLSLLLDQRRRWTNSLIHCHFSHFNVLPFEASLWNQLRLLFVIGAELFMYSFYHLHCLLALSLQLSPCY